MFRRLTSLIVALALVAPVLGSAATLRPLAASRAHACCLRMPGGMRGCPTQAFTCCPAPDRGHESTTPPSATTVAAASVQAVDGTFGAASIADPARIARFDARALARANAPPGPLYLKHSTLLV